MSEEKDLQDSSIETGDFVDAQRVESNYPLEDADAEVPLTIAEDRAVEILAIVALHNVSGPSPSLEQQLHEGSPDIPNYMSSWSAGVRGLFMSWRQFWRWTAIFYCVLVVCQGASTTDRYRAAIRL